MTEGILGEDEVMEGADGTTTRMEEYEEFIRAQKSAGSLRIGDKYYMLDLEWYKRWEEAAKRGENGRREQLNNIELMNPEDMTIREGLEENLDYIFVASEAWKLLRTWYGGGPELECSVIANGHDFMIEVYKLTITFSFGNSLRTLDRVTKGMRVSELKDKAFAYFEELRHRSEFEYELYFEDSKTPIDENYTVLQAQIKNASVIKIMPIGASESMISDSNEETAEPTFEDYKANPHSGLTGLQNLGFTCFMNSALQCLSNTERLTEYFLTGKYEDEINEENPIGRKGDLARAYATVLRHLWKAEERSHAPRSLKFQLAHYAPQFHGYSQQDSQELMAFLMDGLHEDLNRIRNKPIVEPVEGGNEPDEMVASKSWKNHKLRNDSVIVDVFHGQYKSTVVCPTCSKVSVTFDPFMYLTLPLPARAEKKIDVTFVPLPRDGSSRELVKFCMKYMQSVTKIRELREYIAEKAKVSPNNLLIAVKLVYNRLEGRMVYLDTDELPENLPVMAYEVSEDISRITSNRDDFSEAEDLFHDESQDPVVLVEVLQLFESEDMRYIATPELFTLRRSECTGRRITQEVISRARKHFDFDQFESMSEENEPPFQLTFSRKALAAASSSVTKQPVDQGSDEILGYARTEMKTLVTVEWNRKVDDFEGCWDYERALPKNVVEDESVRRLREEKQAITLDECIRFWEKEETLTEQNAWYCSSCKEHKLATKSLKLWRIPDVLVIHLKRFSYTTWNRNKVDILVDFPQTGLDLTSFLTSKIASEQSCIYDLYAVSNHMGGLGGGHYTAYAVSPWKENDWYSFDDASVSRLSSEHSVVSPSAYVLFYRRRGEKGT